MFTLCKKIKEFDNDLAVLFSGEGSDELCGSYMYFHKAPSVDDFDAECYRLLHELRYFDVLRCDKCISGASLEARVPFLDKDFVRTYLSANKSLRVPQNNIEKYLLRKSFDVCDPNLLPSCSLWREKEAFSDGVSKVDKSWYEILQEKLKKDNLSGLESEQEYYKGVFKSHYGEHVPIPHYWLPKWCGDTQEPSARTLNI